MGWDRQRATTVRYLIEGVTADLRQRLRPDAHPPERRVYVMHIEKTGGTSLRYSLYARIDQGSIFPNVYQEFARRTHVLWGEVEKKPDLIAPQTQLIMGHFGLRPVASLDPPPQVATFLRDPVSRMRSAIDFNRQAGRRYDGLSIDEILARHAWREGSMQAQAFGYDHDLDNIDEVIDNLRTVDFIGFFEHYQRDIARLSSFLDLAEPLPSVRRNVTGHKTEYSPEQLAELERLARPDRQLYDAAISMHN